MRTTEITRVYPEIRSHENLHDNVLGLVGVTGLNITIDDDIQKVGGRRFRGPNPVILILLRHSWWAWRGLRNRNRQQAAEYALVFYLGGYVVQVL